MLLRQMKLLLAVAIVLGLGGCAAHQLYRPKVGLCSSAEPERECLPNAVQEYRDPEHSDAAYLLGFVEFDDQGQLWSRSQMRTVIDQIYEQSPDEDVLIIVFAHGWKHSAAPGDNNIVNFRRILERVSIVESRQAALTGRTARKVFGIYLGWRGASITTPVLKELTFWDRKATAEKVGHGGVSEVLSRLELVREAKEAVHRDDDGKASEGGTRLVVIGHSFGGALVYSALAQLLEDRFVLTVGAKQGYVGTVGGFGDLVVLINPAFEANLYAPLSDMTNERRSYTAEQRPVLVILTSEADEATRLAFPLGRSLSTLFEKERVTERPNPVDGSTERIDQGQGNVTAVGHFLPYRTHYLRAVPMPAEQSVPSMAEEMTMLQDVRKAWEKDAPGGEIDFHGSVLTRTANSTGRNPYLLVQVSKDLIPGHNEIYDPRIETFLRQLIFLSAR